MMRVLFAPDWRSGVPYQRLLAEALEKQGVEVSFLSHYKRVLPLRRLLARRECDILHLHWPEAYYPRKGDALDWFRRMRFSMDLAGALRHCKLATTAHNLHAHNRADESFAKRNTRTAHSKAGVVFAHSEIAKQKLLAAFDLAPEIVRIIPHGDLSVTLGEPLPQPVARHSLHLDTGKLVLMFGAVEPYKGQEEVISWWRRARPDATLAIVGNPISPEYSAKISAAVAGAENIITHLAWLPDETLRLWLSAADVALFNYHEIFTSGAANLARSWGVPVLLPRRLDTIVLGEPTPRVGRFTSFDADFAERLAAALAWRPDFEAASQWREECRWERVAEKTIAGYRMALHG